MHFSSIHYLEGLMTSRPSIYMTGISARLIVTCERKVFATFAIFCIFACLIQIGTGFVTILVIHLADPQDQDSPWMNTRTGSSGGGGCAFDFLGCIFCHIFPVFFLHFSIFAVFLWRNNLLGLVVSL